MTTSRIALNQADSPSLVAIARELFREYADAIGVDLEYQGFAAELDALPSPYVPPAGLLLVAHVDTKVAGCVGLRPIDTRIAEMKRLYVRAACRGLGLGEHLVRAMIESAGLAGYRELRLDTLHSMHSAQSLYRRLGFMEIPPYGTRHLPGTHFYSLRLNA